MISAAWRTLAYRLMIAAIFGAGSPALAAPIDYSTQIRPLLADRCFRCHGPDAEAREADLRLDERRFAIAKLDSGNRAIAPGDAAASELLRRIAAEDKDERMPPADAGAPLNAEQRQRLRRWIEEGAHFERHWAFVAPARVRTSKPTTRGTATRDSIDEIVLRRLEYEQLRPNPEADRYTLIRRLTLDLTGLPPTLSEVDRFVQDRRGDDYARLVDRLLASPAFGERWARGWLDLARYADSAGYAQDPPRTIWRYRDWVIQAFNSNLPFEQFTIQQLAGDLLENPDERQLLATAFHRNTMTNSEGGTDDEEFRNAAIVDRVNTTMQVWMGLTMGCAQCHTHKYDPITQEEYFRVFAIFNNTQDSDQGDERPTLNTIPGSLQIQRDQLQREIKQLEQAILAQDKQQVELPERSGPLKTRFVRLELPAPQAFLHVAEVQAFAGERNLALQGKARQSSVDFAGPPRLAIDGNTDGDYAAKSVTHTSQEDNPWWEVELSADAALDRIVVWNRTDNGLHSRLSVLRVVLLDAERQPLWIETVKEPPNPSRAFTIPPEFAQVQPATRGELASYRTQGGGRQTPEQKALEAKKKQLASLRGVATPVMRELPANQRRRTFLQYRGSFLDKGPEVQPGVPAAFHPLKQKADRLGLADWLVDPQNPLTARVAVNRIWQQLFGTGLVETSEDFGVQGTPPSHPELLDDLALGFMESGWDVKQLIRRIVTSATYRQSSKVSEQGLERDPANRLLARGPRFRLSAEMIRDQALSVGGLLSRRMLGPSVQPPRPVLGLRAAFGGSTDWNTSPGEDKFRRGLYTSWRRTTPYPSMTTFDAPSREFCTVRRIRTNTPLQALVTLNDPVYFEAAQGLARRLLKEGGEQDESRAAYGFRLCLARPPQPPELKRLVQLYRETYDRLRNSPQAAMQLASEPIGPPPESADVAAVAAWSVVANVLLNLDETIAKP